MVYETTQILKPSIAMSLTSFTDKNSSKGKTRCRSKYWPIRVVKSNSAIFSLTADLIIFYRNTLYYKLRAGFTKILNLPSSLNA